MDQPYLLSTANVSLSIKQKNLAISFCKISMAIVTNNDGLNILMIPLSFGTQKI